MHNANRIRRHETMRSQANPPLLLNMDSTSNSNSTELSESSFHVRERKTARFDLSRNTVHKDRATYTKDELQNFGVWYNKSDYQIFRKEVARLAKRARENLSDGDNRSSVTATYINKIQSLFKLCSQAKSAAEAESLDEVKTNDGVELIGLEHYVVEAIAARCKSRRQKLVDIVQTVQQDDSSSSSSSFSFDISTAQEREQTILRLCRQRSRPSRMYAAAVAQMLWAAETNSNVDNNDETHDHPMPDRPL